MTNELNREGLLAALNAYFIPDEPQTALAEHYDEHIHNMTAALKAYLPYHNAELEAENKRLRELLLEASDNLYHPYEPEIIRNLERRIQQALQTNQKEIKDARLSNKKM